MTVKSFLSKVKTAIAVTAINVTTMLSTATMTYAGDNGAAGNNDLTPSKGAGEGLVGKFNTSNMLGTVTAIALKFAPVGLGVFTLLYFTATDDKKKQLYANVAKGFAIGWVLAIAINAGLLNQISTLFQSFVS